MNARFLPTALFAAFLGVRIFAADEAEPKSHMKEVLKARTAEEAKKKAAEPAPAKSAKPEIPAAALTPPATTAAPPAAAPNSPTADATPTPAEQPATVLPKVEVKKDRITILDHQLQEQEKEIAREKKHTTPTELDKALNDTKVSKALAIFGGQSNDNRASVAKERVKMMEEEKEVIEAIAHAKTKAEKEELQKELDQLKALRRELEKTLR